MQQGGGIGHDFSTHPAAGGAGPGDGGGCLRAAQLHGCLGRDVPHHHVGRVAARRDDGHACAATIPTSRPSSTAKADPARLRMFNLSVLVTDAFIEAVEADADWDAVVRRAASSAPIRARDAVGPDHARDLRLRRTGRGLHRPRQRGRTTSPTARRSSATNPAASSRCRLTAPACWARSTWRAGADPFGPAAQLDRAARGAGGASPCACSTMSIDVSRFPLPQQAAEARAKRRIGLGVTGLADALLMLGPRYGSEAAAAQTRDWMRTDPPPPTAPRRDWPPRRAPSRCSTATVS
ncbi:MAG: hypothetical protein KatS3mg118_1855 [Paracoccaceae bacterium]|nr:MAG: hypothetical protein KatS3mg118_1855 [Paracoccaceae bacterium]